MPDEVTKSLTYVWSITASSSMPSTSILNITLATPATPGDGSDGGDGADGCIEIYYKAPLPVVLSVNAQGHAIANNAEYLGDDTLELVPTQEANGGHLIYTEV